MRLKKRDGGTVSLAVDSLSEADRIYLCGPVASDSAPDPLTPHVKVVTTGVGINGENALKNAFSHAIEQAVGVLVDAESIIENDQIIRDQVLTFTRGFLQEHAVTGRWQEDGLWHVRIWALITVNPLSERLTAQNVTVRRIPGELLWGRAVVEMENEENAAGIFARTMRDFGIDKLVKVGIVGEPEVVEKNAVTAKLRVQVRLMPDYEKWALLHRNLESILKKFATKSTSYTTTDRPNTDAGRYYMLLDAETDQRLVQALDGDGGIVCLFKKANRSGTVTYWQTFRVPISIKEELDVLSLRQYDLRVSLKDATGNTLLKNEHVLEDRTGSYLNQLIDVLGKNYRSNLSFQADYLIAPVLFPNNIKDYTYRMGHCFMRYPYEETFTIDLDQLRAVDEVTAEITERTSP